MKGKLSNRVMKVRAKKAAIAESNGYVYVPLEERIKSYDDDMLDLAIVVDTVSLEMWDDTRHGVDNVAMLDITKERLQILLDERESRKEGTA